MRMVRGASHDHAAALDTATKPVNTGRELAWDRRLGAWPPRAGAGAICARRAIAIRRDRLRSLRRSGLPRSMRRLEPAEHVQHQLELRLGDIGTDEHTPMCRGDVLNFEVVADPLQMLA